MFYNIVISEDKTKWLEGGCFEQAVLQLVSSFNTINQWFFFSNNIQIYKKEASNQSVLTLEIVKVLGSRFDLLYADDWSLNIFIITLQTAWHCLPEPTFLTLEQSLSSTQCFSFHASQPLHITLYYIILWLCLCGKVPPTP